MRLLIGFILAVSVISASSTFADAVPELGITNLEPRDRPNPTNPTERIVIGLYVKQTDPMGPYAKSGFEKRIVLTHARIGTETPERLENATSLKVIVKLAKNLKQRLFLTYDDNDLDGTTLTEKEVILAKGAGTDTVPDNDKDKDKDKDKLPADEQFIKDVLGLTLEKVAYSGSNYLKVTKVDPESAAASAGLNVNDHLSYALAAQVKGEIVGSTKLSIRLNLKVGGPTGSRQARNLTLPSTESESKILGFAGYHVDWRPGMNVTHVDINKPAHCAGLTVNDVILTAAHSGSRENIVRADDLDFFLDEARNARSQFLAVAVKRGALGHIYLPAASANSNRQLGLEYSIEKWDTFEKTPVTGAEYWSVSSVKPDSLAELFGLQVGDQLLGIMAPSFATITAIPNWDTMVTDRFTLIWLRSGRSAKPFQCEFSPTMGLVMDRSPTNVGKVIGVKTGHLAEKGGLKKGHTIRGFANGVDTPNLRSIDDQYRRNQWVELRVQLGLDRSRISTMRIGKKTTALVFIRNKTTITASAFDTTSKTAGAKLLVGRGAEQGDILPGRVMIVTVPVGTEITVINHDAGDGNNPQASKRIEKIQDDITIDFRGATP